jgi:dihydroorotase
MNVDILIKNGHIYDPGSKIDLHGDLAVFRGKIVSLDSKDEVKAKQTIDASGCFVVPGLIDLHTHVSRYSTHIGLNPDIACIPNGTTLVVDCGSSGVSNYEGVLHTLRSYEIRSRLVLHVSAGGQMMTTQFLENIDPSVWDVELFEEAFEKYPEEIVGLKIRVSKPILGKLGLNPLEKALELAEHLNTRLFVHSTDSICTMSELAQLLRSGDVICHMYHGEGNTLVENDKIDEKIFLAKERGVIFDVSQGQGNFSIPIAKKSIELGLLPTAISTDLNIPNWNSPLVHSLPMTMSKMLALGLTAEEVIKQVTSNPAAVLGEEDKLGTLKTGTPADISILKLEEKPVLFKDKYGNELNGSHKFVPMGTIVDGKVQFQASDTIFWD